MKVTGRIERRANGKLWLVAEQSGPFPWRRVARLARIQHPKSAMLELREFIKEKQADGMSCNGGE